MKTDTVTAEFVESAPRDLRAGVIYISDRFHTALHLCCCGCGREVVTPLNPAGWSYYYRDGDITLRPSIGNWSLPCRSHYLIIKNKVVWAKVMSEHQIRKVKERDGRDQQAYVDLRNIERERANADQQNNQAATEKGWPSRLLAWLLGGGD